MLVTGFEIVHIKIYTGITSANLARQTKHLFKGFANFYSWKWSSIKLRKQSLHNQGPKLICKERMQCAQDDSRYITWHALIVFGIGSSVSKTIGQDIRTILREGKNGHYECCVGRGEGEARSCVLLMLVMTFLRYRFLEHPRAATYSTIIKSTPHQSQPTQK